MKNIRVKLMLLSSILCFNILPSKLMVNKNGLSASEKLGVLKVLKSDNDYFVLTKNGTTKVHRHVISSLLKEINDDELTHLLNNGNGTIKVDQFTNGDFKLDIHVCGKR